MHIEIYFHIKEHEICDEKFFYHNLRPKSVLILKIETFFHIYSYHLTTFLKSINYYLISLKYNVKEIKR